MCLVQRDAAQIRPTGDIMKRRVVLDRFTFLRHFALSLAMFLGVESTLAQSPPSILMIAVDDLRPWLGCYGDHRIQTPNIDRLARRGVVFERAYCQYAKCGTSRLSVMTGLRPDSIGVFSNRDQDVTGFRNRRPDAVSLARWLKDHGYQTHSFGKIDHDGWQIETDWSAKPSPGRPQEMLEVVDSDAPMQPTVVADRFDCPVIQSPRVPDEHLFAGRMTEEVIRTIRSEAWRDPGRPVFLAVGYRRPHLPLVAPRRYFDLYHPDDSWLPRNPLPPGDSPVMAWFNSDGYLGSARRVGLTMPASPSREQAIDWNGYELRSYVGVPNHGTIEPNLQLQILQAYAACISYVDAQIGRLLDELDHWKTLDETIIVLWSDHGWHLGEQSAWSKMTNFDIATRVPLIIAAPGVQAGRTRELAELVDLYPTICELTGLGAPQHLEGESLRGSLLEPEKTTDGFALSQQARFRERYMGRAIRTNDFRFVVWTDTMDDTVAHRELYDHRVDPDETQNVAGQVSYRQDVMELEKRLRDAFR